MPSKVIKKPEWAKDLLLNQPTLFIDPGLGGTGLAYFYPVTGMPLRTFARASGKGEWLTRVFEQTEWYSYVLCDLATLPTQIVIEYPKMFGGSASSYASVQRGDIGKLTMLCGALAQLSHTLNRRTPRITLVHPDVWKGQLPKNVVLRRIKAYWGLDCPDHIGDAVGMGLAAQGLL